MQFFVSAVSHTLYLIQLAYWCMCMNWVPKSNNWNCLEPRFFSSMSGTKKCVLYSSDTWGGPATSCEHNKGPSSKLRLLSAGMLYHVFQYKFTSVSEECWWTSAGLQSITSQKILLLIITTVRISSAAVLKLFYPVVLLDDSNISVYAVNIMCILAIIYY